MPLAPGSSLGPYEILAPLGAGGMGEVFQARDRRLGRRVALKVLPERLSDDADSRGRLMAEARAASALDHPGIVTIFDVGSEGGVDYVAMELVDGQPLSALIAEGPLPIREVVRLGRAIGEALQAAHVRGVIHRDLKPANILVRRDGRPKILDFGLAKRLGPIDLDPEATTREADTRADTRGYGDSAETLFGGDAAATATGALMGTPAYMAPEQARGEKVDARSDLFALGGVLYELVTGRRPFGGRHAMEVLAAILLEAPEPLAALRPDAPAELDRILRKALAKLPDQRYQDAGALVADLEALALADSAPPRAPTPAPAPAPRSLASRGSAAVGAMVLVLATFLGIRAWSPEPAPAGLRPENFRLLTEESGRQPTFSPDGRMLAFTRPDENGVPQLFVRLLGGALPSQTSVQLTHGVRAVSHPTYFPGGDEILYAVSQEGLWAIPALGGAPRRLLDHGARPHLSPDGRRLLYVHEFRIFTANVDGSGEAPLAGVPQTYFGDLASAAFSPDGRQIAVFQPAEDQPLGSIAVLPVEGGAPRWLSRERFEGGDVAWSPDGRFVLVSSNARGSQNLWALPVAGGEPQALTTGAGDDRDPQVSPDGRHLVYANTRTRHAFVRFDPRTGAKREVLGRRSQIILPELSPDRRQLAFFTRAIDGLHLYTQSVDGGEPRQISRSHGMNTHPRWSSDGRELFYYNLPEPGEDGGPTFRRMPADGGESRMVADGWTWVHQNAVCLAPDGRRLAYSYMEKRAVEEARIRDLETGAEQKLGKPLGWCQWSPDGASVVGSFQGAVWLCPADGAACREVAKGSRPRFADAQTLLFTRSPRGNLVEIWQVPLAGGAETLVTEIENWGQLVSRYHPLADGGLIWNSMTSAPPELWIADLAPPGG